MTLPVALRLFPPKLVALTVFGTLVACTPKAEGLTIEAADAFPAEVDTVVGFDFGKLRSSPLMASFGPLAMADEDFSQLATSVEDCKLPLDNLKITFATTLASKGDDRVFLIEAPGAGKPDMMKCMEKAFAAASGEEAGAVTFTTRGKVLAAPAQGGDLLILPNDNQALYVTKKWQKEVLDRVNGDAERTPSKAADAWGRVGTTGHIYFAVLVTDSIRSEMDGIPGANDISDISGRVLTSHSADLELLVNFKTAESAGPVKMELDTMLDQSKADALAIGIPQKVMDSIATKLDGSTLSLKLSVDVDSAGPLALLIGAL